MMQPTQGTFLGITPVSSVSNGLYFLTLPLVSVMRVIYTSKGTSKKFGVRVIYRKIQYIFEDDLFSLVHLVIAYGIIFWGTSSHIKVIFNIQKRIIGVIMNSDSKDSCHSQYIFSMCFFFLLLRIEVCSKQILMFITSIQVVIMIYIFLQRNYSISKWSLFCGIKIYNNLPFTLEWLSYDVSKLKSVLKRFLLTNSPIPWKNILVGNK